MHTKPKASFFKLKHSFQFLIAVSSILFLFFLVPQKYTSHYMFEVGRPWAYDDLYSVFDFAIEKTSLEYEQDSEKILENHLNHFTKTNEEQKALDKFEKLFIANILAKDSATQLDASQKALLAKGVELLKTYYSKGIIAENESKTIVLVENNIAKQFSTNQFISVDAAIQDIKAQSFGSQEETILIQSLLQMCISENVVYDEELNENLIESKLTEISSTQGVVKKGEKIIGKGEIVDVNTNQKIISFNKKFKEQLQDNKDFNIKRIGYFMIISVLIALLYGYLFIYQKQLFVRHRKFALVFILVLIAVSLIAIFVRIDETYIYFLPITIVPIVVRAFFKRETALYAHLTVVFLSALYVANAFEFALIQSVAGVAAIYGNKDVRYWSQFFKAIGIIFIAYVVTYSGIYFIHWGVIDSGQFITVGFLALNAFLSFLAYPLIVFFEKIFGLLSAISLVEYTDINKPLLKRLSLEAPGTFQHSLQVANLAEAAATEIGANSLLVKVGALYHDVGKIKQAIYFIENQFPDENPHAKLSYEESAKIIIGHVIEGVILAKKYKLPEQIIEFIKTHHGTTRVEYFYRMHAKVKTEEIVDEYNFSYPGPAPFIKEHAILMMADSVEAASKSLKNPTHETLSALVDSIIEYQQKRGQFDHVPITLLEISRCKEVFKKMLASIYHIRIEYPKG